MVTSETIMATETSSIDCHLLANKWTMWAHLPHDIDWSINSYKKIYTMQSVEEAIALTETLPDVLVKNCIFQHRYFKKKKIKYLSNIMVTSIFSL